MFKTGKHQLQAIALLEQGCYIKLIEWNAGGKHPGQTIIKICNSATDEEVPNDIPRMALIKLVQKIKLVKEIESRVLNDQTGRVLSKYIIR